LKLEPWLEQKLKHFSTEGLRKYALNLPYSRFQIDGALSENSLVGGVSGTPIGRNAEPCLSLTFFFRKFLEIKKMIKKT